MRDNITRPDHYCDGRKYEPKDVIRDWGLNFNLGSAVKYISRAGRKGDKLEDLKKAKQFLQFEIEAEEEGEKRKASKEAFYKSLEVLDKCKASLFGKDNFCCETNITAAETCTSDVLNGKMKFEGVPEDLKPSVINRIAQKVLDLQIIPPDEVREAVIDRIVERIDNDELDPIDISIGLYVNYRRIREAIANRDYRKMMDGVRKYAEDTEDTVSINFEFEADPEIDTDTVNVRVHII